METSSEFNLENAISQWRQELHSQHSMRGSDIDELEQHLRETYENVSTESLSTSEAFLVARHRIGSPDQIGAEFAKVNRSRVWATRMCWMLLGFLCFAVVENLASMVGRGTLLLVKYGMGASFAVAATVGVGALVGIWAVFGVLLSGECSGKRSVFSGRLRTLVERGPLVLSCVFLFSYGATLVACRAIDMLYMRLGGDSSGLTMSHYISTMFFSELALTAVLLVCASVVVQRFWSRASA